MQMILIGDLKGNYGAIPSLSEFKQFDWPQLTLPIKFLKCINYLLQIMCEIKLRLVGVMLCEQC